MFHKNIKAFQGFFDSVPKAHKVKKFEPPVLKRKLESLQTDVMLGESDADMGIEELIAKFTIAEYDPQHFEKYGICDGRASTLRVLASSESEDCDLDQHEWRMVGRWAEVSQGSIEKAKLNEQEMTSQKLIEYAYYINGVEKIFIDVVNGIERYNGVDRTAARRAAIGYLV